ncbi:MAG: hypothetical protein E7219_02205 [Clostridiales bacterium]|nr:hypothetical protein [Clostridiales bacterium]
MLLFLVCASLSALILVAGTTAAGRISNIAETDQSYYAVTSAADLVVDMMDGDDNAVSVFEVNGKAVSFDKPMYKISNEDIGMEKDPVSEETEAYVAEGSTETTGTADSNSNMKTYLAMICAGDESYTNGTKWTVNVDGNEDMAVTVEPQLNGDTLTLWVYNNRTSAKYKPFKLALQFKTTSAAKNPPITVHDDYTITNSHEVKWSFARMVSSYDAG